MQRRTFSLSNLGTDALLQLLSTFLVKAERTGDEKNRPWLWRPRRACEANQTTLEIELACHSNAAERTVHTIGVLAHVLI